MVCRALLEASVCGQAGLVQNLLISIASGDEGVHEKDETLQLQIAVRQHSSLPHWSPDPTDTAPPEEPGAVFLHTTQDLHVAVGAGPMVRYDFEELQQSSRGHHCLHLEAQNGGTGPEGHVHTHLKIFNH